LGEVWDRALVNLREAGHQRAAQFASVEAIACYERALGVLEHLPKSRAALEARFDILCDLRNVLVPLGPHERLARVLESASALAKALGDEERLAQIYSFLSHYYGNVGRSDLAVETGERALVLGQRVGAVGLLIVGSMTVGEICRTLGDYRKALVLFHQALAHIHPDIELDRLGRVGLPAVRVRSHLAWTLAELGDFPAAREAAEAGLRLADRTKHPYDLAHACLGLGGVHVRQGEFEAAMSILARGLTLTEEVPLLRPPIVADLGLAQARCGRVVEGMALVNEAVERANTIGRISRLALLIVKCGEVHLLAGDALTANGCAAKALRLATEQKERGNVVYATRLFAAIRASEQPGSPEEAAHYREALQLARELGMRPLVAHCHAGLAQHYNRVSAGRQARRHHAAAAALYRAMGMRYWLGQLELEPI